MRYFIKLSYDGTNYHGWQRQLHQVSVQSTIEDTLGQLFSISSLPIVGCGRTDAGVHSSDYIAHFDWPDPMKYSLDDLKYKLNKMLPEDISIENIFLVADDMHARYSAISRTYEYHLHTEKNAFIGRFSSYIPYAKAADLTQIESFLEMLCGITDFSSLSKSNTDVKTFICDLQYAEWSREGCAMKLEITSNRFLRGMVRLIVGTCLNIGLGKIRPERVINALNNKTEIPFSLSAPPQGLILTRIKYPEFNAT